MAVEQTLILIKPDGARRGLTGLVMDRLEAAGLELVAARMVRVSEELARRHYRDHVGKHFFDNLIRYIRGEFHAMTRQQVLALVYQGEGAIALARRVAGHTNPEKADPRSLRGAFGRVTTDGQIENVLHASGTAPEAEWEIKLWFSPEEVLEPLYPTRPASDGGAKQSLVWA